MLKAIAIIRTSTARQEIEAQTNEIISYTKSFGYTDDEIVIIGKQGASAIKLDDAYLENLQKIYDTINDPNNKIECVFGWALDRLGRDEVTMFSLKNFLIEHKVQLRIKNPTLYLLNDDFSVNAGMELAISLFITMAKQEMENKKVRFKRAKVDGASKGKYIGSRYMKFGYTTNAEGYLVIDKEDSKVVKLVFEMYATNKYSYSTLAKELNERGYKIRKKKITECTTSNILRDGVYNGQIDEKNTLFKQFPKIIDDELWNKVVKARSVNRTGEQKTATQHHSIANKILKCIDCNHNYTYMQGSGGYQARYICYKKVKGKRFEGIESCPSTGINKNIIDEILTDLSSLLHFDYLANLTETTKVEIENQLKVIELKINAIKEEIANVDNKKKKVATAFMDEMITEKEYKKKVAIIKADVDNYQIKLNQYQQEYNQLSKNLKDIDDTDEYVDKIVDLAGEVDDEEDIDKIIERVKQHIKVMYHRVFKVGDKQTAIDIVECVDYKNHIYTYLFQNKHGKTKEGLFEYTNGKVIKYKHKKDTNLPIADVMKNILDNKENLKDLIDKINEFTSVVKNKVED